MPTPTAPAAPRPHTPRRLTLEQASLFDQHYSVRPDMTRGVCAFFVRNPEGVEYRCCPLEQSCTCAARGVCRHLLGLQQLIADVWIHLGDDRAQEAYALADLWDELRYELNMLPGWRIQPTARVLWGDNTK